MTTRQASTVRVMAPAQGGDTREQEFCFATRAFAWEPVPTDALSIDATVCSKLGLVGLSASEFTAYFHVSIARPTPSAPWELPGAEYARLVLEARVAEGWSPWPSRASQNEDDDCSDAEWLLGDARTETRALRWEVGDPAMARELGLAYWEEQDWVLIVADPERVEEFVAWYDRATDPQQRFDAMALVLYSLDERLRRGPDDALVRLVDARLRASFAQHAHLVRYWSLLDRRELELDECFALTPWLRRLYWECLVPLE